MADFVSPQDTNLKGVCACAPVFNATRIKPETSKATVLVAMIRSDLLAIHFILNAPPHHYVKDSAFHAVLNVKSASQIAINFY